MKIAEYVEEQIRQRKVILEQFRHHPTVVIINEKLYDSWTKELLEKQMDQPFGYVKTGSIKSFEGLNIITSTIIKELEVY